jgi:hypothetical protein
MAHVRGVFIGEPTTAARNSGRVLVPRDARAGWATEQGKLIKKSKWPDERKAHAAEVILRFDGDIGSLPIARLNGTWLTENTLRKFARKTAVVAYHVGTVTYEDYDDVSKGAFDNGFEEAADIIWIPQLRYGDRSQLKVLVQDVLTSVWKGIEEVYREERVVGSVYNTDIIRLVDGFQRPGMDAD